MCNYGWNRYKDVNNKYENGVQIDNYTQREYYTSVSGLYTLSDRFSFSLIEDFFVNTLDNTLPKCPFPTRYSSLTYLAGQYRDNRLTVTASLLGTYMIERVETGDQPADRKRLSPAVSASWRILPEENLRVRVSYKDIFRVPTFNDLYYQRMGNTSLKPEKATQYNAGLTWSGDFSVFSFLSLSADGYYNRVKDKIVAIPTMFVWKMMNMGEVSIGGTDVNFLAEIPLFEKMEAQVQANYTFQKAIDITSETAKTYRHQIPYTPKHSGMVALSLQNPWVNAGYSVTLVGDRYALPQNIDDNRIDRYAEHTISLNREFNLRNCKFRLQGEVVNLTNKMYDVIQYYPMPGRSWRITLSVNY
ncbi:MAG: TonB-dependent receptor [Parabacteroides gordonii]|nr:TonB-dependent receptor [Parabacteroides gordonii]